MTRADALAAYEALPLPDTTEEHWRFTNLRGFDPDSFEGAGVGGDRDDARPRRRRLRDRHRRRHRDREGRPRDHLRAADRRARAPLLARRLGREVRGSQRGALEARAPGRRPEGRRAREAALRPHLRDRPDLLAAGGRGGGGRPRVDHRGVRVARARHRGLLERRHGALRRAGGEARVRLPPEPLPRDVALREPPRARRARRRARLGRRRLRLEEGQDADPERPRGARRDLAGHGRVLRRRHAAPRLRHVPGAHRARLRERLRLQGRAARRGAPRSGAG